MKRLILLASLAVLMLEEVHGAPRYQVLMNAKKMDSFSEDNTNEQLNLGPKVIEESEKDNILTEPISRLDLSNWKENKDTDLLRQFRHPVHIPEEDRDSFYHPSFVEDVIDIQPKMLRLFHYEVLQGPEEDRDHIYHSAD